MIPNGIYHTIFLHTIIIALTVKQSITYFLQYRNPSQKYLVRKHEKNSFASFDRDQVIRPRPATR